MEKVLIAGGAGFIGSNLCKSLSGEYEIKCIDDFSSGRRENVEEFLDKRNFRLIEHNVIDPLGPVMHEIGDVDYIFHLASRASPLDYQSAPLHTLLSNSVGTYNLLNLAKERGAKFLFASTSEVYGDPLEHPQKETYRGNVNPIGIRACYDESKRFGETLSFIFLREYGMDARVIRIFNTYGPNMKANDGRVVSNFITQALRGEDITVYGEGSQTRSFCYVSDMVEGIQKAMFCNNTKGRVMNIGNPNECTVLQLAEQVKKMAGSKSGIVHKKLPEDDPYRRNPDITVAKDLLGWYPKVGLQEGLEKTIEYFKKELHV